MIGLAISRGGLCGLLQAVNYLFRIIEKEQSLSVVSSPLDIQHFLEQLVEEDDSKALLPSNKMCNGMNKFLLFYFFISNFRFADS